MNPTSEQPRIDVYPVGILSDWKRKRLRYGVRHYLLPLIRHRAWRNVRNYFNGHLAEVTYSDIRHTRCGVGWTRRAALSSLGRRLGEDNPPPRV
jgi:hypothetical protein